MANDTNSKKNPVAVALGRLGGLKGGLARTAMMAGLNAVQRSVGAGSYLAKFEHVDK